MVIYKATRDPEGIGFKILSQHLEITLKDYYLQLLEMCETKKKKKKITLKDYYLQLLDMCGTKKKKKKHTHTLVKIVKHSSVLEML